MKISRDKVRFWIDTNKAITVYIISRLQPQLQMGSDPIPRELQRIKMIPRASGSRRQMGRIIGSRRVMWLRAFSMMACCHAGRSVSRSR